jgi:hypothetical protein
MGPVMAFNLSADAFAGDEAEASLLSRTHWN